MTKMDKMIAVIILFLGVMIITAAVLSMGAVPQIFKTAERTDTLETVLNQTKLELDRREVAANNTKVVTGETQKIILELNKSLVNYIDRQNNTTQKILRELDIALNNQDIEIEKQEEVLKNQDEQIDVLHNQTKQNTKIFNHVNEVVNHVDNIVGLMLNQTEKDHQGAEKNRQIVRDIYEMVKDINSTLSTLR